MSHFKRFTINDNELSVIIFQKSHIYPVYVSRDSKINVIDTCKIINGESKSPLITYYHDEKGLSSIYMTKSHINYLRHGITRSFDRKGTVIREDHYDNGSQVKIVFPLEKRVFKLI